MKVVFATPTRARPHPAYQAAMEASLPSFEAAGIETKIVFEIGCPYISAARATMLRKALDWGADAVVFIDDDLSWEPGALLKLVETEGDVVAGCYRFKKDDEEYMGALCTDGDGQVIARDFHTISGDRVPGGFLKVTRKAVADFMRAYPELQYGDPIAPHIDLFNHGAHGGQWFGEDYSFSRRWRARGGDLWIVPDLDLTHHDGETPYPGNLHQFMMRQPGGVNDPAKDAP